MSVLMGEPRTIVAWQCIGCGRLEAPQNCVGVCQDRKVELVTAWDHAEALAALEAADSKVAALARVLNKLVHTHPRDGAWEASFRALQDEAKRALAEAG